MIESHPTRKITKSYNFYLYEPELNKRHQQVLPTEEMYRFFPSQNQVITINKNPKENYRYIFNGQPKTSFEEQSLKKLNDFINHKIEKNKKIYIPNWWLESDSMRYLQAYNYDIIKTFDSIIEHIKFMENIPLEANKKIRYLLNTGFLYMFGRDNHFRPIIVIEVKRTDLLEKEGYKVHEICECVAYFINYIINYILIPGQIENWIIITDLAEIKINKLRQIKNILGTLKKFRGRVFRNYLLNVNGIIRAGIKGIINILGSASAKKIKILNNNELYQLQEFIREDNIQKKYGGTANNVIYGNDNLFPPIVPSEKYLKGDENLNIVTIKEYKEMCLNSNPFKPFVICEKYKKLWEEEEELLTENQKTNDKSGLMKNSFLSVDDFINIFEKNNNNQKRKIIKTKPKKIDIEGIKNFMNGMKNND